MRNQKLKKMFALVLTTAMAVTSLAGCGNKGTSETGAGAGEETPTEAEVTEEAAATEAPVIEGYTEAPSSADKVTAGEIPAVEERLPAADDIMIETMDSIGTYSDALNLSYNGKDSQWGYEMITEEPLFRFKIDGTVEPNVAKSYEVNEDSTEYTIHLREGMKWSDGVDFTAADCVFFYEHMCLPETFGKSLWNCFQSTNADGEKTPCTMEQVDTYTFKVKFTDPSPNFLEKLTIDGKWCFAPEHYYVNLLPEFIGDDAAAKLADEMGYSDVAAMGKETGYYFWNVVGRPTLRPWVAQNDPADADMFIMARNDYYWKTDAEGKQLPYIDQLHFTRVQDAQQELLMLMDGTLDIGGSAFENIVTLKENEATGNYKLYTWATTSMSDVALQLNQACKNEQLRTLFQDIRFREALSIAVDRKVYTSLVSDDFSEPQQASPVEGGYGYDEEWKNKWTEYDPERAMALLDEIGLVKGSDGFYTFADGTPVELNMVTWDNFDKSGELLIKYFEEIGIKTSYKVIDRTLGDEMLAANDQEVFLQAVAVMNPALRPDNMVPIKQSVPWYGNFSNWYVNGTSDIEPTDEIKALFTAYDKMNAATTKEESLAAADEILKLHKDNMWIIGYASSAPSLQVLNKKLMNFPESSIICDEYRYTGIAHFQCLYFSE